MSKVSSILLLLLILSPVLWMVSGCAKPADQAAAPAATAGDAEDLIEAALDKLSPEDRALAVAQRTCPVSGQRLGSMDAPIIVEAEGRRVFLCCESCRESFLEKPAEYIAKLGPATEAAPGGEKKE
jgi:YHS domain-containing protein